RLRTTLAVFVVLTLCAFVAVFIAITSSLNLHKMNVQLTQLVVERANQNTELKLQRDAASRAQDKAEKAYDIAIHSTDKFLTDQADRLLRWPGVPKTEAEQMLKEGEDFLASFSDSVADKRALAHPGARILLKFAEVNADRGDLD